MTVLSVGSSDRYPRVEAISKMGGYELKVLHLEWGS